MTQFPTIINERPKHMSFDEYKEALKEQKSRITNRIKNGVLIFVSCEIRNVAAVGAPPRWVRSSSKTNRTFRGNASDLY